MYKESGFVFSSFGTNRKAALDELLRQLQGIEQNMLPSIDSLSPEGSERLFLCGDEISLADATLFPTMVFCTFMLPQFFSIKNEQFMGPRLTKW
jgi:hypothetical protein